MTAFYERLGVTSDATTEDLSAAYQNQLARLVKKLRQAEKSGADTAVLEAEKHALMEAHDVLSDPSRRRRYDRFQQLEGEDLSTEPQAFWEDIHSGMVDPAAAAAVDVVRTLTSLPMGDGFDTPRPKDDLAPHPPPPPDLSGDTLQRDPQEEKTEPTNAQFSEPAVGLTEPAVSAPVVHRKEVPPEALEQMRESFGMDGRFLAAVRQAQGVRIEQVAEATKISPRYIEAIETNAFERLPSAIFVKGYLREIAGVLDLDADEVVEGFLALFSRQRGD